MKLQDVKRNTGIFATIVIAFGVSALGTNAINNNTNKGTTTNNAPVVSAISTPVAATSEPVSVAKPAPEVTTPSASSSTKTATVTTEPAATKSASISNTNTVPATTSTTNTTISADTTTTDTTPTAPVDVMPVYKPTTYDWIQVDASKVVLDSPLYKVSLNATTVKYNDNIKYTVTIPKNTAYITGATVYASSALNNSGGQWINDTTYEGTLVIQGWKPLENNIIEAYIVIKPFKSDQQYVYKFNLTLQQ